MNTASTLAVHLNTFRLNVPISFLVPRWAKSGHTVSAQVYTYQRFEVDLARLRQVLVVRMYVIGSFL
jgi:hypothetical protein